jgi:hypothetical protein
MSLGSLDLHGESMVSAAMARERRLVDADVPTAVL